MKRVREEKKAWEVVLLFLLLCRKLKGKGLRKREPGERQSSESKGGLSFLLFSSFFLTFLLSCFWCKKKKATRNSVLLFRYSFHLTCHWIFIRSDDDRRRSVVVNSAGFHFFLLPLSWKMSGRQVDNKKNIDCQQLKQKTKQQQKHLNKSKPSCNDGLKINHNFLL